MKYLALFKLSWQNGFVYRVSLLLWRIRNFLSSLMALTIWTVIFSHNESVVGYNRHEMLSYIFLISVLQSIILASTLHGLAGRIYSGQLSHQLVKPVNIFAYLATEDLGDKLRNFAFAILENGLLYLIFLPNISMPSLELVPVFLLWTLGGALLFFLIQLLFGAIGFWSPETWGPRYLFFMFVDFTAGRLYPLNILPTLVQKLTFLTPFPYLSYVQIQLFLGNYDVIGLRIHSAILLGWLTLLSLLTMYVWRRGLHNYAAAGQ